MSGLKGQRWSERKEHKKQISARLPNELKIRIEKLAESHKRTESQIIALCLEFAVREYDKGRQVLI